MDLEALLAVLVGILWVQICPKQDLGEWLIFKLFTPSRFYFEKLWYEDGTYDIFSFYRPGGSYVVYPQRLKEYLELKSRKKVFEDYFEEMGFEICEIPQPPAIGGCP